METQTLAKESIRYYVGRINNESEYEEVVHTNQYNGLFIITDDFEQSKGFNTLQVANRIANFLNSIEKEIAGYEERETKYHYFTYRKDDKVTHLANYERKKSKDEEVEQVEQ